MPNDIWKISNPMFVQYLLLHLYSTEQFFKQFSIGTPLKYPCFVGLEQGSFTTQLILVSVSPNQRFCDPEQIIFDNTINTALETSTIRRNLTLSILQSCIGKEFRA